MSSDFWNYYYGWMTSNTSLALIGAVIGWRLYRAAACCAAGPQSLGQLLLIVATTVLALVGVTFVTALFDVPTAIGSGVTGMIGGIAAASILRRKNSGSQNLGHQ